MRTEMKRFRWRCSCGAIAPSGFVSFVQAQESADSHYAATMQIGRADHATQVLAVLVASDRRG